jgi:hypothetical protein
MSRLVMLPEDFLDDDEDAGGGIPQRRIVMLTGPTENASRNAALDAAFHASS